MDNLYAEYIRERGNANALRARMDDTSLCNWKRTCLARNVRCFRAVDQREWASLWNNSMKMSDFLYNDVFIETCSAMIGGKGLKSISDDFSNMEQIAELISIAGFTEENKTAALALGSLICSGMDKLYVEISDLRTELNTKILAIFDFLQQLNVELFRFSWMQPTCEESVGSSSPCMEGCTGSKNTVLITYNTLNKLKDEVLGSSHLCLTRMRELAARICTDIKEVRKELEVMQKAVDDENMLRMNIFLQNAIRYWNRFKQNMLPVTG